MTQDENSASSEANTDAAEPQVRLKFAYTSADLTSALNQNMDTQPGIRYNEYLAWALLALGAVLVWQPSTQNIGAAALLSGAAFKLWVAGTRSFGGVILMRRDAKYRAPYDLIFSGEGVALGGAPKGSHLPWRTYTHAIIHKDGCLLYHGRQSYMIIPAHAFSSDADRAAFEALITRHIAQIERKQP